MIIPFELYHLDMMRLPPAEAVTVAHLEALVRLSQAGWVRTIVTDRGESGVEILGIAGVAPQANGTGEVFVVKAAGPSRVEFAKGVRQLLDQAKRHFATIRALGAEGDPAIERWLSWLGFHQSGKVEGTNMILWRLA